MGSGEAPAPKQTPVQPPRAPPPLLYLYCRMGPGQHCCRSYSYSFGPSGCYLRRRRQQRAVRPLVPYPGSASCGTGAQTLVQMPALLEQDASRTRPPSPEAWPPGSYPCPEAPGGPPVGASSQQAGCCGYRARGPRLATQGPGGWRRAGCPEPGGRGARMELSREAGLYPSLHSAPRPSTDLVRGRGVRRAL